MTELVVCSGKGGTGKTSVVASLAALAGEIVLADCDVDAANLHLVLDPVIEKTTPFIAGHTAEIRQDDCEACGECHALCRFSAINKIEDPSGGVTYEVDPLMCEGCGVCVRFCPTEAIDFPSRRCGEWYESQTLFGPLVGTIAFILVEEILSAITIYWHLIFGIMLVALVLYGKGGIHGWLSRFDRPFDQEKVDHD